MEELVFDSFEVQAFDYFVKPVNHERFHKTMERLLSDMQNSSETNLFIQRGNEWSIIPFDDIMYCEIINRKIYLHLERQEVIDFYEKIENMEKKLDNRFFKCHRSYIINLKYVRNYKKDTAYLCNGEEIPVSRLRNEEFTNAILQYMKEWRFWMPILIDFFNIFIVGIAENIIELYFFAKLNGKKAKLSHYILLSAISNSFVNLVPAALPAKLLINAVLLVFFGVFIYKAGIKTAVLYTIIIVEVM